jgi:hypothetical protein
MGMKNHSKEWRWQLVVLARNSKLLEGIVKKIGPVDEIFYLLFQYDLHIINKQ